MIKKMLSLVVLVIISISASAETYVASRERSRNGPGIILIFHNPGIKTETCRVITRKGDTTEFEILPGRNHYVAFPPSITYKYDCINSNYDTYKNP